MTRPGFEDYDSYDWFMHYALRVMIVVGCIGVALATANIIVNGW